MSTKLIALNTSLVIALAALTGCGSGEKDVSTNTEPKTLPDQSAQSNRFIKSANRICVSEQKSTTKAEADGAIELTDYTNGSADIEALKNIDKSSLAKINKRGDKLNKQLNAIENKSLSKIQALDIPSGQIENVKIWVSLRKQSQQPSSVKTLSVGEKQTQKQRQQSYDRQSASTKADLYASLIGIKKCNKLAAQFKNAGAPVSSATATSYAQLKGFDASQDKFAGDTITAGYTAANFKRGLVKSITSPNKFTLKAGETFQFANFTIGKTNSCYDRYALKMLGKHLKGEDITFEVPGTKHQKIDAYVQSANSSFNLKAMLNGYAVPAKNAPQNNPFTQPMQIAARVAMTYRRGVWKQCTANALELSGL